MEQDYNPNNENTEDLQESIFGLTEAEFILKFKERESFALRHSGDIRERYIKNKKVWKGDEDYNKPKNEQTIVNTVFQSVETIIPIITSKIPEPSVSCKPKTQDTYSVQDKMTRYLKDEWEIYDKMQQQLQSGTRNGQFAGMIIAKYTWSEEEQRTITKVLHPTRVVFPAGFATVDELPYIIEYPRVKMGEVKEMFGEDKYKLIVDMRGRDLKELMIMQ